MSRSQEAVRAESRRVTAEKFLDAEYLHVVVETCDYPDRELVEFGRAFERFAEDASVRPIRKF